MTGVLYGKVSNFRTQQVLVAAKVAGKTVKVEENFPQEKFTLGCAPAYEEGSLKLFGATAIASHLVGSNSEYFPKDPALYQYLQFANAELLPNVLSYVLPSISVVHFDHDVVERAKKELIAQLHKLDKVLVTRTFLVGERLSVADVTLALNLLPAFQYVLDPNARKTLVNVTRYFNTIIHQKPVKSVLGEVKLAEKVSVFNADLYHKNLAVTTPKKPEKKQDKSEKKEKKEQPKKQPKHVEEDDDELVEKKSFTDPFATRSSGTFIMDAFKRCYSNEETSVSIPYFWENFDCEHNSIWYCEYKYPTELTLTFMSCNLISGMFQRLEKLKKHAFGSVCLFGTDNNSTISGVWFWPGHDLAFELCPDWQVDYESYEWKKLDPKDEATKTLVNEYLSWEGNFNGKKFNQGKIFK